MAGKKATIAMLDLFNDKVVSVDYNRDQGFLTGMGIDVADKTKNGDEAKTGKYSGGDYEIVCNEPTQGSQDQGKTAMENLPGEEQGDQPGVLHQRAGGRRSFGGPQGCRGHGHHRLRRRRLFSGHRRGEAGTIGATSQQYPVKMAELGVEAIAKFKRDGTKPEVTPGLDFFDTGVALVTDKPVFGCGKH